ncbi:MAG: hypothetical protein KDD82_25370 [Planctomycetes bacterium]|nr:hypothetical protein [Planctomycetota bacterium]
MDRSTGWLAAILLAALPALGEEWSGQISLRDGRLRIGERLVDPPADLAQQLLRDAEELAPHRFTVRGDKPWYSIRWNLAEVVSPRWVETEGLLLPETDVTRAQANPHGLVFWVHESSVASLASSALAPELRAHVGRRVTAGGWWDHEEATFFVTQVSLDGQGNRLRRDQDTLVRRTPEGVDTPIAAAPALGSAAGVFREVRGNVAWDVERSRFVLRTSEGIVGLEIEAPLLTPESAGQDYRRYVRASIRTPFELFVGREVVVRGLMREPDGALRGDPPRLIVTNLVSPRRETCSGVVAAVGGQATLQVGGRKLELFDYEPQRFGDRKPILSRRLARLIATLAGHSVRVRGFVFTDSDGVPTALLPTLLQGRSASSLRRVGVVAYSPEQGEASLLMQRQRVSVQSLRLDWGEIAEEAGLRGALQRSN